MTHNKSVLSVLGLTVALLALPAAARAEFVSYDYSWVPDKAAIPADPPDIGALALTKESGTGVTSLNQLVKVSDLRVFSVVPDEIPDKITNGGYGFTVALTDDASKQSGSLHFKGTLSGTFSAEGAMLSNTFQEPTTQKLKLGDNTYTVNFGPYIPPTGAAPGDYGALAGRITVDTGKSAPPPASVPEPSCLVLALAGASALACRRWRRGRRATA
jgi:hypothetical protein